MLLVLEGINGAGKTTQIKRLVSHFNTYGVTVHVFADPGGDQPFHLELREVAKRAPFKSQMARIFIYSALRADLNSRIREIPFDEVIILDRYTPSFYVYAQDAVQDALGSTDRDEVIRNIEGMLQLSGCITPDLTIFLSINPDTACNRVWELEGSAGLDAFEQGDMIQNFRKYAARYESVFSRGSSLDTRYLGKKIIRVDANVEEEVVTQFIKDHVRDYLREHSHVRRDLPVVKA